MHTLRIAFAAAAVLTAAPIPDSLRSDLVVHASFDTGLEADAARGDRQIYSAPAYKQHTAMDGHRRAA